MLEKTKETGEIKKEDPKFQQETIKDISADKVQEFVEKEVLAAQEKLEKTVSADNITQIIQSEDLNIQKLKLAKSPSADQIPREDLKLAIRPSTDKISEAMVDDLAKISPFDEIQKVLLSETLSPKKAQKGNQDLKVTQPPSTDHIQKDTNFQEVKLPKVPFADHIQREVKLTKISFDKIVQQFQNEKLKHQEENMTEVSSISEFKRPSPTLKQAKPDKIPSADQVWKDVSELQQGKILKASSADQFRLDDLKLLKVKPVSSKSSIDQAQLDRTVEDDSEDLQNAPLFPETKLELMVEQKRAGEAEEKLKAKRTRKQEGIKNEDSTIVLPETFSKDQKSQKEISVPAMPLAKPDHIEALKGKTVSFSFSLLVYTRSNE